MLTHFLDPIISSTFQLLQPTLYPDPAESVMMSSSNNIFSHKQVGQSILANRHILLRLTGAEIERDPDFPADPKKHKAWLAAELLGMMTLDRKRLPTQSQTPPNSFLQAFRDALASMLIGVFLFVWWTAIFCRFSQMLLCDRRG